MYDRSNTPSVAGVEAKLMKSHRKLLQHQDQFLSLKNIELQDMGRPHTAMESVA